MRRTALLLPCLLLQLSSCSDAPATTLGNPGPAQLPWLATVQQRIRDADHPFLLDGASFRAVVRERGLAGRFDGDGASLGWTSDDAVITVRTSQFGRTGAGMASVVPLPSRLGECQVGKVDPSGRCVRRLEYASAGLTEWWEAGAQGFEQGWVIDEPPTGEGALGIDVDVGDAVAVVDAHGVRLGAAGGGELVVGGLRAWGADGDELPAWFAPSDDGFRVVVDDSGAAYPVEVDPVYTSPDWSVVGDVAGIDELGVTVANAGDTNGDGFDDVLVRSGGASPAAYLYLGSASGVGADYTTVLDGVGAADGAGDVNGDGYADVVCGVYGSDSARVYHGGATGLSETAARTLSGSAGTDFGAAVSGAGDVDGDGYDDVVIGAPSYASQTGRAYVYLGSSTGVYSAAAATLTGEAIGNDFGAAVSSAADVNGDGFDDVVVGARLWSAETGRVYVYLGAEAGLDTWATTTLDGPSSGSSFGASLADAGDVDADGYGDIVIGAHLYSSARGRAFVYAGSPSGTRTAASQTLAGGAVGESFGYAVAGAGDVNGDGYSDVLVGAYGRSTTGDASAGAAALYLGGPSGTHSSAISTANGAGAAAYLGCSVAGGGDVDGDGYDDPLAGAYGLGESFTTVTGAAFVYAGSSSGSLASATTLEHPGSALGASVANAGDVNQDGYEDVVIGVPGALGTGEVLVYHGSGAGLGATAASVLLGTVEGGTLGTSVAAAGDTNGDGFDDIVVSDRAEGTAYTYLGSSGGVATTPVASLVGGELVAGIGDADGDGYADVATVAVSSTVQIYSYPGSGAGTSSTASLSESLSYAPSAIAGAGDVDGDGYDDLLVAREDFTGDVGLVSVYPGSASGTQGAFSAELYGEIQESYFGHAIAGVGDVDADGYDDFLVGAPGYASSAGRVYVFHGSATGPADAPTTVLDATESAQSLGDWVGAVGDIDGDGYDDVAVGAPGYDGASAVLVYAGSAGGVTAPAVELRAGLESMGSSVATGDFNADGRWDVVVGDADKAEGAGGADASYGCVDADADGICEADDCDDADSETTFLVVDADGDGYGDPAASVEGCTEASGYTLDRTDCDDTSDAIHPGATEVCDDADVDEDCDGLVDDADGSVEGQVPAYEDADGDGYGGALGLFCDASGHPADSTDCDDANRDVRPAAAERCDGVDNDCNGDVDSDAIDKPTWYADADGDGFSDPGVWVVECAAPPGYIEESDDEDCDDADPTVPFVQYEDADGDGYGAPLRDAFVCESEPGYVDDNTDCDDYRAAIYPGAEELCDGLDGDCDGEAEEVFTYSADSDGDGYTDPAVTVDDCTPPAGYSDPSDEPDCDDTLASVHPGAEEVAHDGLDSDCDGEDGLLAEPLLPSSVGEDYRGKDCGCAAVDAPSGSALGLVVVGALVSARRRAISSCPGRSRRSRSSRRRRPP